MHLIELKEISKTYCVEGVMPVKALDSVSLTVDAGELLAVMGPSGSGKSTLLGIIGLLDKADSGEYILLGKNITNYSENEFAVLRNRFFGFVFQMFNLLPRFNVLANSLLPFIYSPKVISDDRQRVLATLNQIGLGDRILHRPNQLSGGQQQKVAIARALSNKPLVILADEPTGNLDSKSAAEIINILKELNSQGHTIIMVTHEADLAKEALRIVKMHDGKIISDERKDHPRAIELTEKEIERGGKRALLSLSGIGNYFYEGYLNLYTNKLRSFLSILGVMIGVAAVITMLAVGTGAQRSVQQVLATLGTNLLSVRASFHARGISIGADIVTRFTVDDMNAMKKLDSVDRVVPYVGGRVQAVYKNNNWNTSVIGTNSDYQIVRSSVPELGRFINDQDIVGRAKVAVLGTTVSQNLFGNQNPIGQQIRLNRVNFKVIGVMPVKGIAGFRNIDDQIVIPYTTAMYRLVGTDYINNFDVQVHDANSMQNVQDQIAPLLIKLHRLQESDAERFDIRNMADIQKAAMTAAQTFSILLGAIAAVSLVVGGIGIMNIMLVMIMERTREIGLRKALGAENGDILFQFLTESILICVLGGVLGIAIGSLVSASIAFFAGWSIYISAFSIILAFTFSLLTGIIFGLWPAMRAARLQPIVALRYE